MDRRNELSRDVYAHFGLAYYLAECLHKGLVNLVALSGFEGHHPMTRPRFEEKFARAYSLVMGKLYEEISAMALGTADFRERLSKAVDTRNFLAHRFWFERIGLMQTEEGMLTIIEDLERDQAAFELLDREIDLLVDARVDALGLRALWDEGYAEALRNVPDEPIPERRRPGKKERIVGAYSNNEGGLLFQTADGSLWQLCDAGLGWSYEGSVDTTRWKPVVAFEGRLPADVDPRPKDAAPWNFVLRFSTGVDLHCRQAVGEGPKVRIRRV